VLAVALAVGLGAPVLERAHAAARWPVTAADVASGHAALAALVVAPPVPGGDYDRARFGTPWADVDRNGCDTRNDVLRRDLTDVRLDSDGCTVLAGHLVDPYTGDEIHFRRGAGSSDVQVDHVVALADAWASGADTWDARTRQVFANDPANLLAVAGDANQDKGAADAADWLPQHGYVCVYALRQVRVKAAYGLRVTPDEHAALGSALAGCTTAG